MLRCIIVDDEQLARQLLNSYAEKLPNLEVVKLCKNAVEAIQVLQREQIDLMFLDIQMPDLTGVELLRTLKDKPKVVFTTAYSDYAIEGYELDVIDYLLKPINFERFVQAVNKVQGSKAVSAVPVVSQADERYITIKADHKLHKVNVNDIDYVEGLREYVAFHTKEGKIVALESLKSLEEDLGSGFIRVHKSFIVRKELIKVIAGNTIELKDVQVPIGKSYKEQVVALFN